MKIVNPATAIYLRKSREDAELETINEGETLARHKKTLMGVAERQGLNVTKIYEEIVSGDSIDERPEVQKLINELLQNRYQNIVVMEIQRLARGNTKDQGIILEALEVSKAKIVTPEKTYDPNNEQDMEMIEFSLMLSRRELKAISRRMRSGYNTSVREGNYLASRRPYGYDIIKRGRRDRTLKPNDYEAEIVKKMFGWAYNENMGCGEIAKKLNEMNVPTDRGSEWIRQTVRSILTNVTYTGKIRWNKRTKSKEYVNGRITKTLHANKPSEVWIIDGKHPAIIDEKVFEEVQKHFKERVPTGSQVLRNPLAGLLRCKNCGKCLIYSGATKKGAQARYKHYESTQCKIKSTMYSTIISAVLSTLEDKVKDFEIEMNNFNPELEIAKYKETKAALETEAHKLEKKKVKLFDLFEDDIYTKDEFLERKTKIIERLSQINNLIYELKLPNENKFQLKVVKFKEVIESLKSEHININKKNQLLKSVIKQIDYTNTNGTPEIDILFK